MKNLKMLWRILINDGFMLGETTKPKVPRMSDLPCPRCREYKCKCETTKQEVDMSESKPREFWIEMAQGWNHKSHEVHDKDPKIKDTITHTCIHVIEFSAYNSLQKELEAANAEIARLKSELSKISAKWYQK